MCLIDFPDNTCIDFKKATESQKKQIAEILIANYTELVNMFVADADYATITAYWKDFTPSLDKMTAKDFIKKYGKNDRPRKGN